MHLHLVLAIQFPELHGDARPRMDSRYGAVGLHLAIVDGEDKLQICARRKDSAGLHVTSAHADIDEIPEDWATFIFWIQLDGDAAFHSRIEATVFTAWRFFVFYIHGAVGLGQKLFRILAILGIHGLPQTQRKNFFGANLKS